MKDAFLAEICEHPDDDAPRLVYADWLDDHEQHDRAEFIRLQCAEAREPADHPDRPRWRQRLQALAAHEREWAGPIAERTEAFRFRRGFVEWAEIDAEALLDHPALFRGTPLRALLLGELRAAQVPRLPRPPDLPHLAVFGVRSEVRHASLRRLLEAPFLQHLRGLNLAGVALGLRGLEVLAESAVTPQLTHLNLAHTGIGQAGVERLAAEPAFIDLTALDLTGNRLSGLALPLLDRSEYLGNLRRLGLWYNRLGDGLMDLVRMPLFARLRHLSLTNNRLSGRGIRFLADTPELKNLRELWLGVDRIALDALRALVRSPHLHPEARLGLFLMDKLPTAFRTEAREVLGDRVVFDDPSETWANDPSVGWPLWRG